MCVPVSLNRRAVGALGVDLRFKPERDYERYVKFLGVVASMVAQAMKIQRLIEEDKQRLVEENTHLRQELRERYDFSKHHRNQRRRPADARTGGTGGGHEHDRAHPRRVGHRQGAHRARDSL